MEISTLAYNTIITHAYGFYNGWMEFSRFTNDHPEKRDSLCRKTSNKVEMQDAQKHLQRLKTT